MPSDVHVNATSETELSVWWSLPVDTCGADIELTLCAEDPVLPMFGRNFFFGGVKRERTCDVCSSERVA